MEFLVVVLIVLCFYGFWEQEQNFKTLGEMIEELQEQEKSDENNGEVDANNN